MKQSSVVTQAVGTPPELYTRDYYLNESGGMRSLISAVRSGDFRKVHRYNTFRTAIEMSMPNPSSHVLDVGCGLGELCLMLAKQGIQVLGTDYSRDSIKLCNELKRLLLPTEKRLVHFVQMNILDQRLPFSDSSFDIIYFLDVIEHLTEAQARVALRRMFRLLRPGGKLVIHTNNVLFGKLSYRAVAFFYHGWKALGSFGTRSIEAVQSRYEYLHIQYYSRKTLASILRSCGLIPSVTFVRPESFQQVKTLVPFNRRILGIVIPALIYWLSKTPFLAFMAPSLWAIGKKPS